MVEVLAADGEFTGTVRGKKQVHAEGEYHPCAHFFVTDGQGSLLAQLRGPDCGHMRNVWDPIGAAGHMASTLESVLGPGRRRDPVLHAFDTGVREANEELGVTGLSRSILHTRVCRYIGISRGNFTTEDGWRDRSFSHNFVLLLPDLDPSACRLEEGKVLAVRWMSIQGEILPTLDGKSTGLKFADRQPDHQFLLRLACATAGLMQAGH